MHILIASRYLPWPLTEGGRVAQFRTFEALRDACRFTLVVPVYSLAEVAHAEEFGRKFSNVTVVAVRCFHPPVPQSGRVLLHQATRKLARAIFSPPGRPSQPRTGDAAPYYPFDSLNPEFVAAVAEQLARGCDIFQAEFAEMLSLGPLFTGRVPTLFVHHQLHFVYVRRFLEVNGVAGAHARYLGEKMIHQENAFLKTFDSAVVFSEVDRQALTQFCPGLAVHFSPFPSPEEPVRETVRFDRACDHFVFVASEGHRPNVDGLIWFMRETWPSIKRQLPQAVVEVIGQWSSSAAASLPHQADIRFAGFVPELSKALHNKIMIVPIRVGSGIRAKILAAWGASCPVVTTAVGIEGLPGTPGEHFALADDAPAFAAACLGLSQDVHRLNQMTTKALDLVKRHYSLAAVRDTRLNFYRQLLGGYALKKS